MEKQGLPEFPGMLQNAFECRSTRRRFYYVFDAPFLNGQDLREVSGERRAEVEQADL